MKTLLWLAIAIAAVGCQPAYVDGQPNPASPYYRIPTDSQLQLHAPLMVPARSDRVYFQNGEQLPWYEVDRYSAYCALALAAKSDTARRIEPDSFIVRGRDDRYLFDLAQASARARPVAADFEQDGAMQYQVLAAALTLHSDAQPFVERLICAAWRLPQGARSVTLNDIRGSLGERFTLQLAGEQLAAAPRLKRFGVPAR